MKRASHLTKQCDICKLNMYGIWHDFLWKISLLWHKSFPESAKLKCKNVTFLHLKTKKGRDADGPKKNNKNLHSPFETLPLETLSSILTKNRRVEFNRKIFSRPSSSSFFEPWQMMRANPFSPKKLCQVCCFSWVLLVDQNYQDTPW